MVNNVSIATRPLVYSAFRYINNKVWTALAEYIDNSLQSFLNHRDELEKINHDGKLNVSINLDFDDDTITIKDDAYGMDEESYQRAFELANIPLDANGLNEFGMGMKVSSVWLSDNWSVQTSAYGESVKKTFVFDLKEVVDNEETELPITVEDADCSDHYTIVTLKQLTNNKPSSRQLNYIRKHLASIYTKFIREGIINLTVNGELLEYHEMICLNAPYYKNPDGPSIKWRKEISFEAPKPNGKGKYIVKGFIGLLETMSTSVDNGFLLFRRDRVIGTSYEDRYRPEELCGQVGSPRYKRIFGELYLEGFDVSFTKNSFQEDDDLKLFIELLKEDIASDKNCDLFGQAQNYVKPKTSKQKSQMGESLIKKIAQGFDRTIRSTPTLTSTVKQTAETQVNQAQSLGSKYELKSHITPITNKGADSNEDDCSQISIPPIKTTVQYTDGKKFEIEFRCEYGTNPYELYNLIFDKNTGNYTSVINLKNPFFEQFSEALSKPDGINQIAYVLKTMIASEVRLSNNGNEGGAAFRNEFNKLFGTL